MLTPQSNEMQNRMHLLAIFCELQPNQRVLKYFSKLLRFQPALMFIKGKIMIVNTRVL